MESKARRLEKDRGLGSELSIQEVVFNLLQMCKFRAVTNALNFNKR